MRYLLALTLAIGFISTGCEKKTPPPTNTNPPTTSGPQDIMTGIPAATAPAIAPTPMPTPTPVVTPRPTPAAPKGARNYTIQPGDNLTAIARNQLGNPARVKDILAANPGLTKETVLHPGQVIKLPEK